MTVDRGESVLPATLISGIRCHGLTISYSDYPLERSGEASNGDLDEFQLSCAVGRFLVSEGIRFVGRQRFSIVGLKCQWCYRCPDCATKPEAQTPNTER
jgi:hypothetical protein